MLQPGDGGAGGAPAGSRFPSWLVTVGLMLLWLWACGALRYRVGLPAPLAVGMLLALPLCWLRWPRRRRWFALGAGALAIWMACLLLFFTKPHSQRSWWQPHRRPPIVRIDEGAGTVRVHNVRHFRWLDRGKYEPSVVDQTYFLDQLDSLDLVVAPLGGSRRFAHTMLSFGFGPERRAVISIEARRERGETFSFPAALFYRQYERFYQVSSERDAFTLRALEPGSQLFVFPVKASPELIRGLFLEMVREAHALLDSPELYRTFGANCTTKLFEHIGRELPEPPAFLPGVLFPARAGERLHELGWMDTELGFVEARGRYELAEKVREFAGHPEFSRKIRE